jgi:hypothetical protein
MCTHSFAAMVRPLTYPGAEQRFAGYPFSCDHDVAVEETTRRLLSLTEFFYLRLQPAVACIPG